VQAILICFGEGHFRTDGHETLHYILITTDAVAVPGERAMAASPKEFREFAEECLRDQIGTAPPSIAGYGQDLDASGITA
jgi:hypothetical protein